MLNEIAISQIGQRPENQSAIVLVVAEVARCIAISLAQRVDEFPRPLRVGAAGANYPVGRTNTATDFVRSVRMGAK